MIRFIKKMFMVVFMLIWIFGVLGGASYTVAWFYFKASLEKEVHNFVAEAGAEGTFFTGSKPTVSGFPGSFIIRYSGTILHEGYEIILPQLEIKSYFFSGLPLTVSLPQGAYISNDEKSRNLYAIDYGYIEAIVPPRFPEDWRAHEVEFWHHNGGNIAIKKFIAKKQGLTIGGNGNLFLDDALQPAGNINATLTGVMPFVTWLVKQDVIKQKDAVIAMTVLAGLMQENPETQQRELHAALKLQNRKLFLGPLQVVSLPVIQWGNYNRPDQLR